MTTRAGLAASSRSVQAGPRGAVVRAGLERHIDGRARSRRRPACSSATASAWGRPPGAVAPRPTISPVDETITQPTLGLGALRPRASSPSRSASSMKRRSAVSATSRAGSRASGIAVAFLFWRRPFRLVLLLVGDDLGVGAVRRIELDVDDLRRRRGADLGIDQEFDDDDHRHQERQRRADHLLAAALAHEGGKSRNAARGLDGRGNQDMGEDRAASGNGSRPRDSVELEAQDDRQDDRPLAGDANGRSVAARGVDERRGRRRRPDRLRNASAVAIVSRSRSVFSSLGAAELDGGAQTGVEAAVVRERPRSREPGIAAAPEPARNRGVSPPDRLDWRRLAASDRGEPAEYVESVCRSRRGRSVAA